MKNSNNTIGNRTRDLPACSAVPQPTAPPLAPNVSSWYRISKTHRYSIHKLAFELIVKLMRILHWVLTEKMKMNNVAEPVVHFVVWRQTPYKLVSYFSLPRRWVVQADLLYSFGNNWPTFTKLEMKFMRLDVATTLWYELTAVGNDNMAGAGTSVIGATLATLSYALESKV
jgi:hypothetical protein